MALLIKVLDAGHKHFYRWYASDYLLTKQMQHM